MEQLNAIDDKIHRILQTAKDTLDKLHELPQCDNEAIEALSLQYCQLVAEVQVELKQQGGQVLRAGVRPLNANYADAVLKFISEQPQGSGAVSKPS